VAKERERVLVNRVEWARGSGHRPGSGGFGWAALVLCYRRQGRACVGRGPVLCANIERKKTGRAQEEQCNFDLFKEA
jgi:hypothetical protein